MKTPIGIFTAILGPTTFCVVLGECSYAVVAYFTTWIVQPIDPSRYSRDGVSLAEVGRSHDKAYCTIGSRIIPIVEYANAYEYLPRYNVPSIMREQRVNESF